MKKNAHTINIALTAPRPTIKLERHPSMAGIFLKALCLAPFRSNTIRQNQVIEKNQILLNRYRPDQDQIASYCKVCGFEQRTPSSIPISFFQTLFISILGKYITSPFFPFNPLGLIQIFQSFELNRDILVEERLDLSCTLDSMKHTPKGYETDFKLQVLSGEEVVWQGISRYLSRKSAEKQITSNTKNKNKALKLDDPSLPPVETIKVPADIGRRYARVSKDFNPHHLYPALARLFGFKTAIAHGMWSLARTIAHLDKTFDIRNGARVEAAFKLPVFIPATIVLGAAPPENHKADTTRVRFELRDKTKGLPHLKGHLFKNIHG